MRVEVTVKVRFARLNLVQRDGEQRPGHVHLVVNHAPLCGQWSAASFSTHPSGNTTCTPEQFLDDPCKGCYRRLTKGAGITKTAA